MSSELDPVDVRQQLRMLYQRRVFILSCTLLGTIGAIALAFMLPRVYVAEAALVVSRPKIDDQRARDDRVVVIQTPESPSTANFRPLIESRAIAMRVIADLKLNEPPYRVAGDTFFDGVVEIEEVRNSSVLLLRGRLADAKKVADVVNRLAEVATETARQVSQQEALQARDDIKLQLNESKTRFETLDKQLAASRTELVVLERQKAQLATGQLDPAHVTQLNALYAKESEIKRLETERDLAKAVYEQVANSYESARLVVAARSSGLHLLSRAVPPENPEPRKLGRNMLIGSLSGFLLASLVVLVRGSLGSF
jgi:uncharacterized protein involved in exopolysaccharide biosynthesis